MTILDVTIDFETCALSANAAVMQLAAVPFQRNPEEFSYKNVFDRDMPTFNARVDLRSCVMDGFDFDKETLKWWAEKPQVLKDEVMGGDCYPLKEVMEQFAEWLVDISSDKESPVIVLWAQGADFDIAILRNVFRKYQLTLPVAFHNFRDARTFIIENGAALLLDHPEEGIADNSKVYEQIPAMPGTNEGMPHNALFDAVRTSWNVAYIFSQIGSIRNSIDDLRSKQ